MASTCTDMSTAPTNCGESALSASFAGKQPDIPETATGPASSALAPGQRLSTLQNICVASIGKSAVVHTQNWPAGHSALARSQYTTTCQLQLKLRARPAHQACADWVVCQGSVEAEQPQPEDEQAYCQHHVPEAASNSRSFRICRKAAQGAYTCTICKHAGRQIELGYIRKRRHALGQHGGAQPKRLASRAFAFAA